MQGLLEGSCALITGAGAGIGRAIAVEMASQGARVFFAEKDPARCQSLEAQLRGGGAQAHGFVCDVSRPENLDELMAALDAQGVFIDVLVNNAGITPRPFPETSPDAFAGWQSVMDLNVLAPLYLTRLVAARLIEAKRPGSVLFISSVHGRVFYGVEVYSASKAALNALVDEFAVPLALHGIRVNGIAPGFCREREDGTAVPFEGAPLHRQSVRPCFVGRAAVFLASDYFSHHTTGALLQVDGGLSLYAFRARPFLEPTSPPLFPTLRRGAAKVRRLASSLRPKSGGAS